MDLGARFGMPSKVMKEDLWGERRGDEEAVVSCGEGGIEGLEVGKGEEVAIGILTGP
jgi:hypothetical protein